MAAALFVSILGVEIAGAAEMQSREDVKPVIRQEAVWNPESEGRADVTWSIEGLQAYIAGQTEVLPEQNDEKPEIKSGSDYIQEMQAVSDIKHTEESYEKTETMEYEQSADMTAMKDEEEAGTESAATEITGDVYTELETAVSGEEISMDTSQEMMERNGEEYATEISDQTVIEDSEGIDGETIREYPEDAPSAYAEERSDEIPESILEEPVFYVVDYVSEYFEVVADSLPDNCTTEQLTVSGQDGSPVVLTKLIWQIELPCTEKITGDFQIDLKPAFRNPQKEITLPVSQDEPLEKDCSGAGMFLVEKREQESRTVAQAPLCVLVSSPEKQNTAEIYLELKSSAEAVRAGESLAYTCLVKNTGEQDLYDIQIESSFSDAGTKAVWEREDQVQVNGMKAKISELPSGKEKTLRMTAVPDEGMENDLIHTVVLEAFSVEDQQFLRREAKETVQITPLKAEFEVEKTADHTTAVPGDTVTYQICIRNTGEKTLHSVLSTERFLNANIQAQFLPKEGVTLNSTRTQALIPGIAPGEAVALLASVMIPPYFTEQQLINEVTVTTEETGEESIQAQSTVEITSAYTTITMTPTAAAYYKNAGTAGTAFSSSSKPATGDETEFMIPVVLLILSILSGIKAYTSLRKR